MAEFKPVAEDFSESLDARVSWPSAIGLERDLVPAEFSGISEDFDLERGFLGQGSNPEPYSYPSTRGAAIAVLEGDKEKNRAGLSNISFVDGTFGGMSSSIAYIRYWSRTGSQQRTAIGANPVNGTPADPQQNLSNEFTTLSNVGLNLEQPVVSVPGLTSVPPTNTPTNTSFQSSQITPVQIRRSNPSFLEKLGSVFSANPGGTPAPAWQNPFYTPPAAPDPTDAVWQFLFNPEELQLSSGPDYNRSETWGVSDPANSGQALSWRSNKNRKLTFGKVLLHGYSFGKRVDSLEAGLQELFTARDGNNGGDGPPVLEFVWGERVFGPCVIQNIQVREQAWDKGLLVNAEVSFELEQIPEWTINDGFVDVVRPGKLGTVNDPLVEPRRPEGEQTGTGSDNGGSGDGGDGGRTSPTPPASNPENDADFCAYALRQSAEFQEVFKQADKFLSRRVNPLDFDFRRFYARDEVRNEISRIKRLFQAVKNTMYITSGTLGSYVDKKVAVGCRKNNYMQTIKDIQERTRSQGVSFDDTLIQWIHGCTRETKNAIDTWVKQEQPCKRSRSQGSTSAKQRERVKKCEPLQQNKPCSEALSLRTDSSCASVNGYAVRCKNGKWVKI